MDELFRKLAEEEIVADIICPAGTCCSYVVSQVHL